MYSTFGKFKFFSYNVQELQVFELVLWKNKGLRFVQTGTYLVR